MGNAEDGDLEEAIDMVIVEATEDGWSAVPVLVYILVCDVIDLGSGGACRDGVYWHIAHTGDRNPGTRTKACTKAG